jgi:hypothetical protein
MHVAADVDRRSRMPVALRLVPTALGILIVMLAVAGGAASAARPRAHASAGQGALFNRETYQYSSALQTSTEAGRYSVMVLQATDASKVAALHRANRRLTILMYQAVMHSATTDPAGMTTCTPYAADAAQHPDWFLRSAGGNRVSDRSYPSDFLMNVGNRAYRRACAAHALALARRGGFDGIYLDGVNTSLRWLVPAGVSVPQYRSLSAWLGAMYGLLSTLGGATHAQRMRVVANIGGSTVKRGLWQRWTTPLDGSEEESWTDGGSGLGQQVPFWSTKLADVAWSEAHGKLALVHSYNTTEAGNTYGLASMVLVAAGATSYSTSNLVSTESWYPEYSAAQQLGPARGHYARSAGAYVRAFARGIVVVNPTLHSVRSIRLGGTYSGSGLRRVRSVSLRPTSGLILLSSH